MNFRRLAVAVVCACALMTWPAAAQEGHPLKGSWLGTWTGNTTHDPDLVLVLNWDGKAITGNINPGPNAVPIQKATLDADKWMVHLEADGKDVSGKTVRYLVDGKLENIGAYARVLSGTWTEGGTKGDFKVVRN